MIGALIHHVEVQTFGGLRDAYCALIFKLVRSKNSGKLYWRRLYKRQFQDYTFNKQALEDLIEKEGYLILKRKERAAQWKFLRYNEEDLQ